MQQAQITLVQETLHKNPFQNKIHILWSFAEQQLRPL